MFFVRPKFEKLSCEYSNYSFLSSPLLQGLPAPCRQIPCIMRTFFKKLEVEGLSAHYTRAQNALDFSKLLFLFPLRNSLILLLSMEGAYAQTQ